MTVGVGVGAQITSLPQYLLNAVLQHHRILKNYAGGTLLPPSFWLLTVPVISLLSLSSKSTLSACLWDARAGLWEPLSLPAGASRSSAPRGRWRDTAKPQRKGLLTCSQVWFFPPRAQPPTGLVLRSPGGTDVASNLTTTQCTTFPLGD